jgi:hypothetical protein
MPMLKDYLKYILPWCSKELKPIMRDYLKAYYREDLSSNETVSSTWVIEEDDAEEQMIQEDLADLLYECMRHKYYFGNYTKTITQANNGTPNPEKSYNVMTIEIPIRHSVEYP